MNLREEFEKETGKKAMLYFRRPEPTFEYFQWLEQRLEAGQHETLVSGSKFGITDLRIGNFVTWIDDEEEPDTYMCLAVQGVTLDGTVWVGWEWEFGEGDSTDCGLDTIKPIPITLKLLERLGFNKYEWCNDCAYIPYLGQHMMLRYYNAKWHCNLTTVSIDRTGQKTNGMKKIIRPGKLEYVHQLQNLYYSLTGKELVIER